MLIHVFIIISLAIVYLLKLDLLVSALTKNLLYLSSGTIVVDYVAVNSSCDLYIAVS